MNVSLASAILFALSATSAHAAASDWYNVEGGGIRLVATASDGKDGRLRGVLEILLKPGWKTYWRDPGDAGVPPFIDVSASPVIESAAIDFPAPHRFNDGQFIWAGYKESVALPVTFALAAGVSPGRFEADVFVGICETICIPVQAKLAVDLAADGDGAEDSAIVEAAFAALPEPAGDAFGVVPAPAPPDKLVVQASVPQGAGTVELFVASADGYFFGVPELQPDRDRITFVVPVLDRPSERPVGAGIHYTMVTEIGAVSGTIPYP